jgi:hypothetical protein
MAGAFLSLGRVLPNRYPLERDIETYIGAEHHLGRMLDYAVIAPQQLYGWSADELREPRLLELVRDGNPIYAWALENRHVWKATHMPWSSRILKRAVRPARTPRLSLDRRPSSGKERDKTATAAPFGPPVPRYRRLTGLFESG